MAEWEREVFEKEYANVNWFKGKQAKHVKEMEMGRKRSQLGTSRNCFLWNVTYLEVLAVLTASQRKIFDQVKAFVHERRKLSAAQQASQPPLTMPNTFPARDREFVTRLADDMHLSITWDEYDEDQNLVTWRFPGQLEEPIPEDGDAGEADDEEWEDEEEEESRIAVDRVLNKYEKAKVAEEDKEGDFDARYELSIKEKMDEWKRGYYKVNIAV